MKLPVYFSLFFANSLLSMNSGLSDFACRDIRSLLMRTNRTIVTFIATLGNGDVVLACSTQNKSDTSTRVMRIRYDTITQTYTTVLLSRDYYNFLKEIYEYVSLF